MAFSSNPTKADLRHSELLRLLEQLHPEPKALLDELSNLIGDLWCEAETAAVILHGEQILAAIEGRGFAGTAGDSTYMDESRLVQLVAS
jgi:hypothetical protein